MVMLLDTDLCIGLLRRRAPALASLARQKPDQMLISTVTVFELQRGIDGARDPLAEQQRVDAILKPLRVVSFDAQAAIRAGQIASALDHLGQGSPPFDILLAGHALALEGTMVTANVCQFSRVEGLRIDDWSGG